MRLVIQFTPMQRAAVLHGLAALSSVRAQAMRRALASSRAIIVTYGDETDAAVLRESLESCTYMALFAESGEEKRAHAWAALTGARQEVARVLQIDPGTIALQGEP